MAYPDYNQFLQEVWGWSDESIGWLPFLALASNILVGTNPPYTAADFVQWFPAFAGTPTAVTGTLADASSTVTNVSDTSGLSTGILVQGTGVPCGTVITNVYPVLNSIELSNPATADGDVTIKAFASSTIPMCVLNGFIYLASNSILQVRYCEMWPYAMALYIAHYCTMWLQSQAAGPGSTPGQLASSGLAMGIGISKHVGDVSIAYQPLRMPEEFGTWNLTTYGQQLATMAMAVGSGPVWCW